MLARILYYPTLGAGYIASSVSSRNWYDRIDETVIVGALPFKSVTKKLIAEENVKAMVTMNEDYELRGITYNTQELQELGVEQLRLRVTDLTGTPTQENIATAIDFIMSYREQGESVYVHCKAGRTRSVTIAVCYLMKLHEWTPSESIKAIKEKRPHAWLRRRQLESVEEFYENMI